MAKELPYFKFNCAQWMGGDITLEDFQTQGVFINICAYYWFKSGCLKTSEIKPRVKCKQSIIDKLFADGHLKSDGEFVKISFLDEQFSERGHVSVKNSANGSKGGAPIGNKNAQKIKPSVESEQPKTTNIEREREGEENKKEKERREAPTRNFEWFKSQINVIWLDALSTEKKLNLGAAQIAAWEYLSANPAELAVADSVTCTRLLGKQFQFMKHTHHANGSNNPKPRNTNSAEQLETKQSFSKSFG